MKLTIILKLIISTLTLMTLSMSAHAQTFTEQEALSMIGMMEDAYKKQDISGRFVHITGNEMKSVNVLHAVIDDIEYERITHLNGPMAEIIRRGQDIICLFPDNKTASMHMANAGGFEETPLQRKVFQGLSNITESYQISAEGFERIAGQLAVPIQLKPKDMHRFHYQFWINQETGVLLKSTISDHQNNMLEQFEFTQLDLMPEISLDQFSFNQDDQQDFQITKKNTDPSNKKSTTSFKWQIGWIPNGFIDQQKKMVPSKPSKHMHMVTMKLFTDGLSSFSIFIEMIDNETDLMPTVGKGATILHSRLLTDSAPHYAANLMGEIPVETAMKILDSIQITY